MNNPLFNAYMNQNVNGITQRINQLKNQFGGDPMAHIQRMLNSGRVSQEQYNRAVQQAQQIQQMLGNNQK